MCHQPTMQYKYQICFEKGIWRFLAQTRNPADPPANFLRSFEPP